MRDKVEGKNRGGGETTPVTKACPEAAKQMCENIFIYILLGWVTKKRREPPSKTTI